MKKIIFLAFSLVVLAQVHAQTKVTKENVQGKWTPVSLNMPGLVYYNIEKDSLVLGEMMKAQVPDKSQLDGVATMMKSQFAMFAKMYFKFNADGTAEMNSGAGEAEPATYTVDEANSTITTVNKEKKTEVIKAEIVNGNLMMTMKQPQTEITMALKKAK